MPLLMSPKSSLAALLVIGLGSIGLSEDLITWEKRHLDSKFYSEGAGFGDVNKDGNMDVLSGPFAWLGPDFSEKIEIYQPKEVDPKGYSDNFLNFSYDINQDGWIDYLVIGFPGAETRWYENPKGKAGHWPVHSALKVTDNESPNFADITGDGQPEIICSVEGVFGYAAIDSTDPTKPFVWHPISAKGIAGGRFTHGLGIGDVDGDGRMDLLDKGRWQQQPKSLDSDPEWKAFRTELIPGGSGGAQMYSYDFDGDGDNDIISSLNAHAYGLAWYEQVVEGEKRYFTRHLIMGQKAEENRYGVAFSQMHGVALSDINGDGISDLVTGKRYWAHGGKDPGGSDPAVLYWFETVRGEGGVEFVPHQIDTDSGVGCQVQVGDLNADGFPDVIVGNKKGTFIHFQKRKTVDRDTWLNAQPKKAIVVAKKEVNLLVRETDPLSPEEEHKHLKVIDGFEIELFASEPMINKPINLATDKEGRVWVSSTAEYPFAAETERWVDAQGSRVRESKDAIKILEDTDGDGKADKVADFADGLNIPTGVLPWHKDEHKLGCIAWSIPNIWYFADTSGDGKADHREVLFGPLGYEKDTHGMCSSFRMGADGWVYATHGFNNTSTLRAKDGSEITMQSGNVFRFRPDGSRVELWSGGQVNPFGLAFDRRGNLYSADCHSSPIYQLIHGATYPHFGKAAPGIGFGPVMIEHTHGSTGICGIVYLDRNRWGAAWNDHVLIGNPVNSRVNMDQVVFSGTTPGAIKKPDFIVSEDPWFRPVDLCFDNEGSLFIADFYNRIIGHYEVPIDHPGRDRERGRIWKVTPKAKLPTKLAPLEIPKALANPVLALKGDSPFGKRQAAGQLYISPQLDGLQPLIESLKATPVSDSHLRHALRLAIREALKLEGAFTQTGTESGTEIYDILTDVKSEESADFLAKQNHLAEKEFTYIARYGGEESVSEAIKKAGEIAGTDTGHQARLIEALQTGLQQKGSFLPEQNLLDWAGSLAETLLAENPGSPIWSEGTSTSASPWILQPRKCADNEQATVLSSLRKGENGSEQRTGTIVSKTFAAPTEISFWICGHRGKPGEAAHDKNFVSLDIGNKELERAYPPRSDTCQKIVWKIPAEQQGKPAKLKIVDGDTGGSYAWLGVTRISVPEISVDRFSPGGSNGALTMLAQYLRVTAPVSLRDRLKPWLPKSDVAPVEVSPELRKAAEELIAARTKGFADAKPSGAKGAEIFQQHCSACHQVKRKGGLIGPQLDGVGSRGVARLCEDILDPNRNVDVHFRLNEFEMADGESKIGFVLLEEGDLIQLRDVAGKMHRLSKSTIKSRKNLPASLMPAGFGQMIPESDFYELLGWLLKEK